MAETNDRGVTFGEWLLAQCSRDDALGDLASSAMTDPKFPRRGSPDDVRKRLNEMQVDGDTHAIVDDAETDWLSH